MKRQTAAGSRSANAVPDAIGSDGGMRCAGARWWWARFPALAVVFLLCAGVTGFAAPPAPAPTPEPLAMAGFFDNPKTSAYHLGFSSSAYVGEQGIWGLLMITQAQGEQLRQAFAETLALSLEDPTMDPAERKRLETEYKKSSAQILTEDQKALVAEVNRVVKEWVESGNANGAGDPGGFYERLKTIATPEQMANFESLRGQKP